MEHANVDQTGDHYPSFASFVCSRLPINFLRGVRPLINASYESTFQGPPDHEEGLPYWKNVQPHQRNRLAFEAIHNLAGELGLVAVTKTLENGYNYLEVESNGLSVHLKHLNNYQPLKEQMVKADYRRQMTQINAPFGQMPLFPDGKPTEIPDKAYLILFFADDLSSKVAAGSIFFVLPSNEEGVTLATCEIEDAISAFVPSADGATPALDDIIDLPPKIDDGREKEAK